MKNVCLLYSGIGGLAGIGNEFILEIKKEKPSFLERLLGRRIKKISLGFDYYSINRPPYGNRHQEIKEVTSEGSILRIIFEITENPGKVNHKREEIIDIRKYI